MPKLPLTSDEAEMPDASDEVFPQNPSGQADDDLFLPGCYQAGTSIEHVHHLVAAYTQAITSAHSSFVLGRDPLDLSAIAA